MERGELPELLGAVFGTVGHRRSSMGVTVFELRLQRSYAKDFCAAGERNATRGAPKAARRPFTHDPRAPSTERSADHFSRSGLFRSAWKPATLVRRDDSVSRQHRDELDPLKKLHQVSTIDRWSETAVLAKACRKRIKSNPQRPSATSARGATAEASTRAMLSRERSPRGCSKGNCHKAAYKTRGDVE